MDKELLIYRIDSLLEHIDLVFNDTKGLSVSDIENSNLLLRTTCFSVAQIGEMTNQLEKELSPKYDRLPWVDARKMRNIIVHDYVGTDVEQVYSTIQYDFPRANICPTMKDHGIVRWIIILFKGFISLILGINCLILGEVDLFSLPFLYAGIL